MDDRSKLMRSEWKFSDDRKWLVGAMIKHGDLAGNAALKDAWGSAVREYILKCDRIPQEHILLLHDLVAELFLQQNYEVTSWIAHQLMQEMELVQMLVYPSLRTAQQELCHAFHAAPIDQGRVALSCVEQVEMIGDGYRSIRTGTMRDGRIEWLEGSCTGAASDRGTTSTHCDVITSKNMGLPPTVSGGSRSIRSFP